MKKMVYFSVLWHLVRKLREYCTGVTYSMTILHFVIDMCFLALAFVTALSTVVLNLKLYLILLPPGLFYLWL